MSITTMEIPATMKGAMIVGFNEPLQIQTHIKVPEVPDERILVKIEASSLCSSDLFAHSGHMPWMTTLPYCGGHESVGIIAKVGKDVKRFGVGDRVGYMMFTDFCGVCPDCFAGEHRYCSAKKISGFSDPYGGFSEYALAHPASTVKLPDAIEFYIAAPLFCGGITAYSAILKAKVRPGKLINIVGAGGVGHMGILFAKAMGYRVHAYDVTEVKLKLALDCGADKAFNSISADATTFEKGDSTIVYSGAIPAYAGALAMTNNHGTVVAVGLPPTDVGINVALWGSKDISFIPCNTGSIPEIVELLDLAVRHSIKPKIEVRHIDTINNGYKDLAEGKIDGRIVYHFN